MFKCKHKFGEVKDGFQYCTKCDIARAAPCAHKWGVMSTFESGNIFNNVVNDVVYMMQCEKCGELEKVSARDSYHQR